MPRHYYLAVEQDGEERVYRYAGIVRRANVMTLKSALGMRVKPVTYEWMREHGYVASDFLTRARWDGSAYYIVRR